MNAIIKRMAEISQRKLEIRELLEDKEAKADVTALGEELRNLDAEVTALEERKALLEKIGNGSVGSTSIDNPIIQQRTIQQDEEAEYRSAWLKSIRHLDLTDAEQRAMTTASGSAGAVVPTTTVNKIIEKVKQYCPLLSKIDLLRVSEGVKVPAEGTTIEAKLHTEGSTISADADTIVQISLQAYEITKLVTISKSVERMSIDSFESYLVNKISRAIADKIGALILNGTGTSQAQGINAIKWDEKNSVTVASSAALKETDVNKVASLLNGGYDNGAEWLMSKKTFFADFYPLMNNSKNNVVTANGGDYYVIGYPVSFDDRQKDHEAILGNLFRGYVGNLSEDVTVTSQFVTRENAYDFLGCAMFDGKVQAVEAFVKIVKGA